MLCVGANVHLDGIVLRAVDKALGHEVVDRFHVTNNLPGAQFAVAAMVAATTDLGYTRIEIACEATGMLWIPFPSLFEHGTALAAVRAGARLPQPQARGQVHGRRSARLPWLAGHSAWQGYSGPGQTPGQVLRRARLPRCPACQPAPPRRRRLSTGPARLPRRRRGLPPVAGTKPNDGGHPLRIENPPSAGRDSTAGSKRIGPERTPARYCLFLLTPP
jgi:hypothetical protein